MTDHVEIEGMALKRSHGDLKPRGIYAAEYEGVYGTAEVKIIIVAGELGLDVWVRLGMALVALNLIWADDAGERRLWMTRLNVPQVIQGRGMAKLALSVLVALLDRFEARCDLEALPSRVGPEDASADLQRLYASFGWEVSGDDPDLPLMTREAGK